MHQRSVTPRPRASGQVSRTDHSNVRSATDLTLEEACLERVGPLRPTGPTPVVRNDNSLNYQSRRFRAACRDDRLRQEFITPEQNGVVERLFRSLKEEWSASGSTSSEISRRPGTSSRPRSASTTPSDRIKRSAIAQSLLRSSRMLCSPLTKEAHGRLPTLIRPPFGPHLLRSKDTEHCRNHPHGILFGGAALDNFRPATKTPLHYADNNRDHACECHSTSAHADH